MKLNKKMKLYYANSIYRFSGRSSSQGFTLIELLVTIIIVGVLSSIALPSFLNQIGKARGTEAKTVLGSINRTQQAYRLENSTMASSYTLLQPAGPSKFYSYDVAAIDANNATAVTTTQQSDLKAYSARIQQSNDTIIQVICESNNTVNSGTTSDLPVDSSTCFTDYKGIK